MLPRVLSGSVWTPLPSSSTVVAWPVLFMTLAVATAVAHAGSNMTISTDLRAGGGAKGELPHTGPIEA